MSLESARSLPPALLERALEKLGFSTPPPPTLEGLGVLYRAWGEGVPFDNIRKRIHLHCGAIGVLPGDEPHDLLRGWVLCGTGGTCWAGNGALAELLRALGFEVRWGVATMLASPAAEPNHGTVSVELGEERYLVDASMLFQQPLPLREDRETSVEHPAHGVRLRWQDGRAVVQWRVFHDQPLDCRIERLDSSAREFSEMHEATRAWSPFNYQLSARIVRGDRVLGVSFGRFAEISPDGSVSIRDFEPGERVKFLIETLGVSERVALALPADEPMPPRPAMSPTPGS